MWWKLLLLVAISVLIVYTFITPAPNQNFEDPETSRIFYYHIPQAWICVIAFAMSMIYSIAYLKTKNIAHDDKALVAAKLGFVFCVLATLTGSVFAKVTWGSFWNWDPRETSIFILLLIYGAYFALRGAIDIEEKRASLAGVYSIFAFVTVPFLIFILPRMVPSLHPNDSIVNTNMKFTMGASVRIIFFSSLGLFTILYFWMFNLGCRVQKLIRVQLDKEDD